MLDFDTDHMFFLAGGAGRMVELLQRHNFPAPSLATVYSWKTRGRISPRWLAPVVYALLKEGRDVHELMKVVALPPRPEPV